MKVFEKANVTRQEDIQIQIPTSRLSLRLRFTAGSGKTAQELLETIRIRCRLVSPAIGTRTIIERMNLRHLFEIGASTEGFYSVDDRGNEHPIYVAGNIEIARGGELSLSNQSYLSFDIDSPVSIELFTLNTISHAKTTTKYIHYNPVTIVAGLQNIPLVSVGEVVLPLAKVENVQLTYPTKVVEYSNLELQSLAISLNDIVYVNDGKGSLKAGSDTVMVLPASDLLTGYEASRIQVEPVENAGQFNVYLLEEQSL